MWLLHYWGLNEILRRLVGIARADEGLLGLDRIATRYVPYGKYLAEVGAMAVAKVFRTGRSQAIRLPKEFRVATTEVHLRRTRDGFLVTPKDPWESFAEGIAALSDDAFAGPRVQPRLERRS